MLFRAMHCVVCSLCALLRENALKLFFADPRLPSPSSSGTIAAAATVTMGPKLRIVLQTRKRKSPAAVTSVSRLNTDRATWATSVRPLEDNWSSIATACSDLDLNRTRD